MATTKHTTALLAAVMGMGLLVSSVHIASAQDTPSLDSQSYGRSGSTIDTRSTTDNLRPDATGKRPGILDWAGAGLDVSQHPNGPGHDHMNCGICQ